MAAWAIRATSRSSTFTATTAATASPKAARRYRSGKWRDFCSGIWGRGSIEGGAPLPHHVVPANAGTHNHRRELLREGRPPARPMITAAAYGSRISARVARLSGTTNLSIRISNSRYTSAFSRRDASEVCGSFSLKTKGAGNAGCALHPRSRVQKVERKSHTSIQGSGGDPTFPAQWLYGLFRALPGLSGFLASVASRKPALRPGRAFAPPKDLTPTTEASEPHDFAVRLSTARRHVL